MLHFPVSFSLSPYQDFNRQFLWYLPQGNSQPGLVGVLGVFVLSSLQTQNLFLPALESRNWRHSSHILVRIMLDSGTILTGADPVSWICFIRNLFLSRALFPHKQACPSMPHFLALPHGRSWILACEILWNINICTLEAGSVKTLNNKKMSWETSVKGLCATT